MTHKLDRRRFLRLGTGAAIALGASSLVAGCRDEASPPTPTATANPLTRVAAVKGNDLPAMARNALDALGGIAAIVNPGETVFIKPNFVTIGWANLGRDPFVIGECTKPELVAAVAEECLKAGASAVTIGDATQMPSYAWEYAKTLDGATNLAAEAQRLNAAYKGKVTLACLDADSPDWIEVPSQSGLGTIAVSSLVVNADRVISMPVLKTHQWTQLTLSLKCFLGTTPLARYGALPDGTRSRINLHLAAAGIEQVFLDIVAAVKPDLAIIDASIGIEGDGPSAGSNGKGGKTVDMKDRLGAWLLLAGRDPVAVDATAARVISHDVSQIRQLNMAYAQGLGETREEAIELVGERLDSLRVDWLPATPASPDQLTAGPSYCPMSASV